ncbi:MAG TPA: cation-transporting P-type ATPase, partial [Candidatus Limnocylindrales bacterium]|nr:cation-transporting P-type ATPase [Candidatus Limnocylindrales bacterium]
MSMQPITASSIVPVADPFAATAAEVLDGLDSSEEGLSGSEAARRVHQFGANRLPAPARQSLVRRVAKHFDDVLIYILLAAAVLKAILGEWVDFWVILAVAA